MGRDQRCVIADHRFGLRPAPHDREFGELLVLDDLGLIEQFGPGLGRIGDTGLLQDLGIVEQVLGIENPGQAITLVLVFDRGPGTGQRTPSFISGVMRSVTSDPALLFSANSAGQMTSNSTTS